MSELKAFLEGTTFPDSGISDQILEVLVREGVTLSQLRSDITDADLEEIGLASDVRALILTAAKQYKINTITWVKELSLPIKEGTEIYKSDIPQYTIEDARKRAEEGFKKHDFCLKLKLY